MSDQPDNVTPINRANASGPHDQKADSKEIEWPEPETPAPKVETLTFRFVDGGFHSMTPSKGFTPNKVQLGTFLRQTGDNLVMEATLLLMQQLDQLSADHGMTRQMAAMAVGKLTGQDASATPNPSDNPVGGGDGNERTETQGTQKG